jgi:ribosomal protein L7/L12
MTSYTLAPWLIAGVALIVALGVANRVSALEKANVQLRAQVRMLLERAGLPAEPAVDSQILALLREGQKIQAIKLYRENTGKGLREAKDAVEAIARGEATPPL